MLAWCVYCRQPFRSGRKRGLHGCPDESAALDAQDREDEMTEDNIPRTRRKVRYKERERGPTTLALALARAGVIELPADERRALRLSRKHGWG